MIVRRVMKKIGNKELLESDVDVLIAVALEKQIYSDNPHKIKAGIIVEGKMDWLLKKVMKFKNNVIMNLYILF